jgi:DNA repair exonuclease SbcCD ATPase subunit
MSKIIRLETANVKKLKAVEVAPDGNFVVIGGENGAGKSSILDSIEYALGGGKSQCEMPLRIGAEKGYTVIETDKFIVKRTYTKKGTALKVTNPEGLLYQSPQQILDALVGELAFDPLAFMRQKPAEQAKTFRELFGIDTTDLDEQRKQVYAERTAVNRDIKNQSARLETMPWNDDAPDDILSTEDLVNELREAHEKTRENDEARERLAEAGREMQRIERAIEKKKEQIAELKKTIKLVTGELELEEYRREQWTEGLKEIELEVSQLIDPDFDEIQNRMGSIERLNSLVRENRERTRDDEDIAKLREKSGQLTEQIDNIDKSKSEMMADIDIPVEGLELDSETGRLTFDGLPLEQCSQAEQLRISVAMGVSQNSELRVMLIREGSLLDESSMKILRDLADANDTQVWIEVVGKRGDATVVIEDGAIKR